MQVPRPFAVFFPQRPFGVQNGLADFLLSFLVADQSGGQKRSHDFLPSFWWLFGVQNSKKDGKRSCDLFLSSKRMPKRHQKVAELILSSDWSPKGRLRKKDGKKSWHLHSAIVHPLNFIWIPMPLKFQNLPDHRSPNFKNSLNQVRGPGLKTRRGRGHPCPPTASRPWIFYLIPSCTCIKPLFWSQTAKEKSDFCDPSPYSSLLSMY